MRGRSTTGPFWRDRAKRAEDRIVELSLCLRIAHAHALQGGYNLSDPDDHADANRVRRALGAQHLPEDAS